MFVRVGACLLLGFGAWFLFTKDRPVDKLREFSPDGTFKVLMPGVPTENAEKSDPDTPSRSWTVRETFGKYTVGTIDVPAGVELSKQSQDFLLEKMGEGELPAGWIVIREEKISLAGKYPGRYVEVDKPSHENVSKQRYFVTKNRAYMLIAEGPKHWINSPDTMRFLESLQLIGEQ
jgi:hypothetical protein